MFYKEGMLCKHFKGEKLIDKNIYKILKVGVSGKDIDESVVTYTGDGILEDARDLVVYQNIFQENKFFAREESDISSELSSEKQGTFHQVHKVEPLTDEEISVVCSDEFKKMKVDIEAEKHKSLKK